ncbi:hypothetical protein ACFLW4_01430 [Chloroflexota bacterium]
MMENNTGVEYIGEGGFGDEAEIIVQLRREFPGVGGVILTYQSLAVASRTEFNYSPHCGHKMFYKHAIVKKLEDYFFKTGVYRYPHVTRPLGSSDESYIYEWAFGNDGFPWEYIETGGAKTCVHLDEWHRFIGAFNEAGIDVAMDCSDPNDGRISKNIVHQLARPLYVYQPDLNRIWKRVDFGDRSIQIDYDKLAKYLTDNSENLRASLSTGRPEFIELTYRYLSPIHKISERDLGKLEQLTLDYRMSTLSHLNARGVEVSPGVKLRPR